MNRKQCGRSGLELSSLGIGCWSFGGGDYWGEQSQADVDEVVRCALDSGINTFDTAEAYNEGRSETSLGRAMRGISRERVILCSKVSPSHTHPRTLVRHCEASLKRLATEYIDLYMVHWPIHARSIRFFTSDRDLIDHPPASADAFESLIRLQQQGKIRHIGLSNFSAARLEEVQRLGVKVAVNQLPYNLLSRAIEYEILPFCRTQGVGVVSYMTVMQGLLIRPYNCLDDLALVRRRTRHFDSSANPFSRHGGRGSEEEMRLALDGIEAVAGEIGCSLLELAIGWVLAQKGVCCALVGARSRAQVEANAAAVIRPLDPVLVSELETLTRPLKEAMGAGFDYFESLENDRT